MPVTTSAPSVTTDVTVGLRRDTAPVPPVPADAPSTARRDRATKARPVATAAASAPSSVGSRRLRRWPLLLLAAPAFTAIWSGWVGLGQLTGFGKVNPLPGTPLDGWTLDTAITLPIGVETYAAYALRVWLSADVPPAARRFAQWSAIGSLILGAAGQVGYHLMTAAGMTAAPWPITAAVACLPVLVLGMGAGLAHLIHAEHLAADADAGPPAAAGASTGDPAKTTGAKAGGSKAGGSKPAGTAAKVAQLRAAHPDWTVGQIAAKAGVSERTASRHLKATGGTNADSSDASADPRQEVAA